MAKRGGRSGRKYVRDSIGRFATTGATARGGRLKTKSGKKRATQTVKAKTGSKPAGALKAKPRSEGQKYAGRVQAGKDLKRSQSTAREKKFFAKTQKRLDAAPLAQSKAAAKPAARTSKAPANKAKAAYKRASGDARMRNADLRGADAKERRMANSASAKVKNMQRRRSTSAPKAGAEAPRSKQKAREFARIQRAYGNERRAYAAKGDGFGSAKQSRTASVAKRARDIYSGKISASYKTTSRLTRTQNPDVLKARIKRGEKLTAARAKKKSVTANSARATGKPAAAKPAAAKTKLKRSGEKIGVGRLTTNKEQGRKGIVSMSSQAKAARKGAVAERKSEKMSRIAERQSEIVARRQGRRASNYNPDGTFNQSTANANQRRLGRSKQLQEKLRYAGGGKNIASKALSKRRKAKPAAAKPAAAKRKATPNSKTDYTRELLGLKRKTTRLSGTDYTREIGRAKGNKRIKNLNQQIKEAGPNAAGLRLEKLKVQTRMGNKPRQRAQPTAKQLAKEASRNDAIRKRSAELRAQSARLAEAKVTRPAKPKRRRS